MGVPASLRVLILGASYGLLPGVKLALAGHRVTFVGRAAELSLMVQHDLVLRIPRRKSDEVVELRTRDASFTTPGEARPEHADLVILAIQEPQLADPEMTALVQRVSAAGTPCLSIMNLPPPPFLRRLGLDEAAFEGVYASIDAWEGFAPEQISNASPDPQALRIDQERPGELTVTLASNFKSAPFADPSDQAILSRLARDMSRLTVEIRGERIAPPVRMLAHSSPFIPLAKWPMLIAGNCRCVTGTGVRTIAEAVHADVSESKAIYDVVVELVLALGAPSDIFVPFAEYARAAEQLVRPSSAARAIAGGTRQIERIDLLVLNLMRTHNLDANEVANIVELIEERLQRNRRQMSSG